MAIQRKTSRMILLAALLVMLVAGGLAGLYITNHLPFLHRNLAQNTPVTASPSTKGEPAPSTTPNQNSTSSSDTSSTKNQGGTTSTSTYLIIPFGDFVSSHSSTLSDNPAGSGYITSTCTTTPGARCQIVFTQNGVTKSLLAETTDAGGTAYWNHWKVADYLTTGKWTIEAVATLNGQTKTATDSMQLGVTQ